MREVERVWADIEAARADLFEALTGISQAAFEEVPPGDDLSVRDALWRIGLVEDWTRRAIDQGVHGRPVSAYVPRARPAIAQAPEYLAEWLAQCRRPLLALLLRLPDDALDASFTLADGEVRSARGLLADLVERDRAHTERVLSLRRRHTEAMTERAGHGDA